MVDIWLPRFRSETAYEMKPALMALGMTSAFSSQADFSGMSEQGGVFLSDVIHKAVIEVNEAGTSAVAASAVIATKGELPSHPPRPEVFHADHPFVFLIRDQRSGEILFIGRGTNPSR